MRLFLPLLILSSLVLTGQAMGGQRYYEITWTVVQYSNVTIAGYLLYEAEGDNVSEINGPNFTSMLCELEVACNNTSFTMITCPTTGAKSLYSQQFRVYSRDALVPSITCPFDATATNNGTITKYAGNFEDVSSSYSFVTGRCYVTLREYTVSLNIHYDTGNLLTTPGQIAVAGLEALDNLPAVSIPSSSTSVRASPLLITSDSPYSFGPDSILLNYVWNFGDRFTTVRGQEYQAANNYTAELTVQNSAGATVSASLPVIVSAPADTGSTALEPTAIIIVLDNVPSITKLT